jgi:hypothetical protein
MSTKLKGAREGFVKTISALTSIATVLTLSGAAYLAPMVASAAVPSDYGLTEGNTISASGTNDPDVYIVNELGYKRLFLNPVIFSFYGHLGGFANVKSVSAVARDAFPTSGLFRNCETNDQAVWAVEVNGEDTAVFHHVAMSGDAAVAQDSNFFKKVFCINNNEANWYPKSPNDYTSLSQVPVYARVPGSTPTPTSVGVGPVSASLSPDNPASGTVIAGQGVADLAHFRLTNPAGNAVAVNSLKFQRLGISGDTTFANVYVFSLNPNARLTDAVTPSSGVITVNGGTSTSTIVTVPGNSYVDIAVKTDVYGTSTSGQTIGVALTQVNGMAVSGLNGNLFQIAAAPSDLATAQFTAAISQGSPATTSVTPATGTTDPLRDTVVWQDIVSINNKNIYLKSFALRQTNSINNADVSNFRLFIDGTQVAQVQNLDANGYVTFNPVSPVTVLTGSRTVKILADITGGTSRKLTLSLRSSADVQMTDSNYGSGVSATIASSNTFPLNGGDLSINSGSIVVQKDVSSPSGNVVKGTSDAVLGRWTFTAYGEPTKVSTLIVGVHSGTGTEKGLRNGRIMVYPVGNSAAAQQYGSTTSLQVQPTSTTASVSFTTNLVVNPGTPVMVEARADIYDNVAATDVTAALDTLTADLYTGSSNGQGMVSLTTSAVPTARINANTLTIAAGSMTISQNASFPSQQIVVPQSNVRIGSFVVAGNTSEAVNVNTLTLDVTAGGANGVIGDLTNVYLKWNGIPTSTKSSITATGNTYSVNQTLPVNGNIIVDVYSDLANEAAATYISKVAISGTTVQSAQTVNTIANGTSATSAAVTFTGQTMTIGSSVFASAVAAANPAARIVASNQSYDVAKFTFTSTVGNSQISELQFKTLASSSQAGIASVTLKKADGTVLGAGSLSSSGNSQFVTFGSLSGLTAPANSSDGVTVTVAVTTGGVGVNMASSALNVGMTLNYVKYTDPTGVLGTDNTDRVGQATYLHAAYPIVTAVALPSTLLTTGVQTISKFTVAATNGSIGLGRFYWTINKSSTENVSSTSWQLLENGIDISSFGQWASLSVGAPSVAGKLSWTASSSAPFNGSLERLVSSTTPNTYELRVNVTAVGSAGDSYQANLTRATAVLTPSTAETFAIAHGSGILTTGGPALVWSDRSAASHTQSTADWMNDYLINSFPISQGLNK